ncbi:MAG: tRNA (adenosine(37)-N6)-threonylcarbamoyltransferase complex dimerization subunit type 1 TsaB [Deltaproteobacteria bacterium]|nr:tRNA (adenosine(37)-N6)-threonylcarbamoyltransferase complex dimerization subunit type 1 TsaB [Deltaproteobacteria bacterium]
MKILAIDTATTSGGIAILEDDRIIAEYTDSAKETHSEKLLPFIDNLLKSNRINLNALDCFAVAIGPGSFTGLRVGIATIKGLAWPLKKPVVGISTLKALAMNIRDEDKLICPLLDARKNEVYAAVYEWDGDNLVTEKEDCITNSEDLLKSLNKPTVFIGDGIDVYGDIFKNALGDNAIFAPHNLWRIKASNIAKLAFIEIKNGNAQPPESIMPNYLRKSYAEIKLNNLT